MLESGDRKGRVETRVGVLGRSEGCLSFWRPVEGNRLASLERLEHGAERVEKKRTAGNESVVIINQPQKFLELVLCRRPWEPLNSFTLRGKRCDSCRRDGVAK